jgi:hypothetical protein
MKITKEQILNIIKEELTSVMNGDEEEITFPEGQEELQSLYDAYNDAPVMRDRDLMAEKGSDFLEKYNTVYGPGGELEGQDTPQMKQEVQKIEDAVVDYYENPDDGEYYE